MGVLFIVTGMVALITMLNRKKQHANVELVRRNKELSEMKKIAVKNVSGHIQFAEKEAARLTEDLINLMKNEKIYRNTDISVSVLAEKLNTNREYLSKVLNNIIGKKFNDFINEYRIEEAKEILTDLNNNDVKVLKLAAIAEKVSFKNTSTFNPIFKEATGLTPSEYKKAAKHV